VLLNKIHLQRNATDGLALCGVSPKDRFVHMAALSRFDGAVCKICIKVAAAPVHGAPQMRPGESYRLKTATLGVTPTHRLVPRPEMDQPRTAMMIPKYGIVTIVALDGDWMVDVIWNGETIMLVAQDLCERGELVEGVGS
jgi:hypothetical protein